MAYYRLILPFLACALTSSIWASGEHSGSRENSSYIIDQKSTIEILNSAEYKILINHKDYSPELLWALMTDGADETGIAIQKKDEPMKRDYYSVQYLDSEDGGLFNLGYVLRYRQGWDKFTALGSSDNEQSRKYDITFKFRDSDLNRVLSLPVSMAREPEGREATSELQADISPYGVYYSRSIKVKLKEKDFGKFSSLFESTVSSYAELFPHLLNIGLLPQTAINPVGGLTIIEERVKPGTLVLSCGVELEVVFTRFLLNGEELVAEASFSFTTEYEMRDENGNKVRNKMSLEDFKEVEGFFRTILNSYGEKVNSRWSKTNSVYEAYFPQNGEE